MGARLGVRLQLQDVPPSSHPPPFGGAGGPSVTDVDATRRRGRRRDGAGVIERRPVEKGSALLGLYRPNRGGRGRPFRVRRWAED